MDRNRAKLLRMAGTLRPEAERILREITRFAELPLRETQTSEILSTFLKNRGFRIERGIAGMDTAFRAEFSFGRGKPAPGWEDSTLGNMYAGRCLTGEITDPTTVRSGIEYMVSLATWYQNESARRSVGFFQIGGGIAGDFPICVVPMLEQDLELDDVPRWGYFCQISDSTTSYGSYSGAVPNEKITWGKLAADTPKFVIESDATIVAPLIFAYVMDQ